MKKTITIIIVVLIVTFGIYYLSIPKQNLNDTNLNTANNTPTNTVSELTVEIKNFSFNPSTITIKTGTKVTWANNDSVAHTVTSDSGNLLNSTLIAPGQSFSFTFTNPGSTNYHCTPHPTMKGSIVVEN